MDPRICFIIQRGLHIAIRLFNNGNINCNNNQNKPTDHSKERKGAKALT